MKKTTMLRLRWTHQLWYVPVLGLAMGLMMVRTLAMAKILDVPSFAQYSGGLLVSSTFCMLGCLGLQSLLQREMPMQMIWRRERAAIVLLMQCMIVAAGCAFIGWLIIVMGFPAPGLASGISAAGIFHGLSQQVFLIATVESRSRGESLHFARQNLERAGIAIVAGCVIGALLESAVATLLAEGIVSIFLTMKIMHGVVLRSKIKIKIISYLAVRRLSSIPWISAMTLLATTTVSFIFLNADRWLATKFLQPEWFAIYSFAWILLLIAQSLQSLINASFFPMLARKYAESGSSAAFNLCAVSSAGMLLACAILFWPAGWLLNAVVLQWFPVYAGSTGIIGIFLIVAAFRISDFWGSYLIITGKEKRQLLIYILVGTVVFSVWLYKMQSPAGLVIGIDNIAALAMALTVLGYFSSFSAAWFVRKFR
jgi:O-antigen/teichoic acid export membrane protein